MPATAVLAVLAVLIITFALALVYVLTVALHAVVNANTEGARMTERMVRDQTELAVGERQNPTELIEASGAAVASAIQAAYGPVMAPSAPADMDKTMAEMLEEAGADDVLLDDEDVADWTDAFIPDPGGPMGPGAVAVDARGRTINVFDVEEAGELDGF